MPFSLDFRAHSEVGLVRRNNQDSGYASPRMLMVADGMGGAAAGDLASTVAIREILRSDGNHTVDSAPEVLAGALARANHQLADLIEQDSSLDGMGTTVCGGLFTGTHLSLVHLGDSRGYLLRAGTLHRLTHDHSWVQSLVDDGKITPEEAAVHPHRSLLLKVLNGQSTHQPDLDDLELSLGDRLLFCSDGLCGFVDDATIRHIVASTDGLDQAMERLVAAAHRGGGADNITILLADVLDHAESLEQVPSVVVGAALERDVPETEDRTLVGALSDRVDPVEPAATGERYVDDVAELDDEVVRYAPRTQRRRAALLTGLVSTLTFVLVAAGGLYGAWRYTQHQYFVGADGEQVAVFQGVPGAVLGRSLNRPVEHPGVAVADLPSFFQQQVHQTIPVADLAAAETTVAQLRTRAQACIAKRHPTPTPRPGTTPSGATTTPRPGTPAPSSRPGGTVSTPSSLTAPLGTSTPTPQATPGTSQEC